MSGRDFLLPDLGEGLASAEIVTWLVAEGDTVGIDQPVAEVETAKAVVEVPCPFAGRVSRLHGAPGDTVAVGAPLISITATAPEPAAGLGEPGVVVPRSRGPAENGRGGNGAAAGEPGSGAVLVGYGTGAGTPRRRRGRQVPGMDGSRTTESRGPSDRAAGHERIAVVSPLVRRIARENGIDIASVPGTGERGLILRRDVMDAVARAGTPAPAGPARTGPVRRVPLRGARGAMAEKLSRSRREIPEATVWVDVDASGLLDLRRALNEADPGRPVGLLALVARFCLLGLARYPALNSRVDTERAEVLHYADVNLGFAAQTPRGLLVPVVHGAQAMSTRELAAALGAATESARAGRLRPAQLTGGTFTVNNYGVFGVDGSAAIINHPEAAILGMGRIAKRPWVVGDDLAVRPVTELTLAFDHRVCDGEQAGGFLRFVADCVERPAIALGEV
ncbi:pyruvate dehydrogenase E2 component (dihydrolipoamide acetyltransferase) [Murinocardiopsis flavida]|uniref:Dihydrolipoamide acetyltransferase component of pyruvate dehydrogenase complex n=1 Tax=Murinocardiopsis flavida TaxID=645275 RepID=A0A2P8DGZ2_9ACTN|nr:dihydrolipoamide acetyltransferase family protein [Murinocardiopsis flavida]PSK96471.1 pyruvate dehydrogenase E2 component (dihydrolipoamide acetyltransferase) [Murinocardiopsis flavida]